MKSKNGNIWGYYGGKIMRKDIKRFTSIVLLVLLSMNIFIGCTDKPQNEQVDEPVSANSNMPEGEPVSVIDVYYQALLDGSYEEAYNQLSTINKNQISLEDFKEWQWTYEQVADSLSYKIAKQEEIENYSYNGTVYDTAIRFAVVSKDKDYATDKELTSESEKIVVVEENQWKILDEQNYIDKYASIINALGWMYLNGKGVDEDPNKAVEYLKKATELSPDISDYYYYLALAYNKIYDDHKALAYVEIGITKTQDPISLSNFYNVKGISYDNLGDYDSAVTAYYKALEYNPDNTYASGNLKNLE